MYKCKYFIIEELVPKDVFDKYGPEASWQFFDVGLLKTLDAFRERFGPLGVNNWKWGGGLSQRGLRSFDFGGISNRSLHKLGKACDFSSKTHSASSIREYVLANPDEFPFLVGLEMGVDWVHFDTRNREGNTGHIFKFSP